MSLPVPITGTATVTLFSDRPGAPPAQSLVTNSGPSTVYVGGDRSQVDALLGYPLGAGDSVQWDSTRRLFGRCAPGDTATVQLLDTAGAAFSVSALASQLIGQGLPQAIAEQGAIYGTPPIDRITSLIIGGSVPRNGSVVTIGTYDTTQFSALRWKVHVIDVAPSVAVLPGVDTLLFYWLDAAGNKLEVDSYDLIGDDAAWTTWEFTAGRIPVRGEQCRISFITRNVAGGSIDVDVQGSMMPAQEATHHSYNGYYGRGGSASIEGYGTARYSRMRTPLLTALAGAAPSILEYVPTRSGECSVHFSYNAAVPAQGIDILVQDWTGDPLAGARVYGGGAASLDYSETFYMPNRPVTVFVRNHGAAALTQPVQITLTWKA